MSGQVCEVEEVASLDPSNIDQDTACYMCDRQVSIRLGKGFWSRGPGPALHLRAADFPTLQEQALGPDNMGLLFQAHLELTQLISNAHDILYSSTSHRQQLYIGGEYVRYIVRAKQLYQPVGPLLTAFVG